MIYRVCTIIFTMLPFWIQGQSFESLNQVVLSIDTNTARISNKLDSIQFSAVNEYDKLKNAYDSIIKSADNQLSPLKRSIDSLQNLRLPVGRLSHGLDSIERWKDEKLKSTTAKIEKLQSSVTANIKDIDLPPALQDKASELIALVDKLDVTLPTKSLPASFQQNLGIEMPGCRFRKLVTIKRLPMLSFVGNGLAKK